MTGGIFISYRRDDARHAAGRLADDLAEHFDPQSIFRDIEGIDPGVDFVDALEQALGSCAVMLVLIGHQWLGIQDADGRRRLQLADDWIRLEITSALKRGIRVVPVLLEGARLPDADELPEDLRPLCRRQTAELSDSRWRGDLRRLVDTLSRVPGLERSRAHAAPAAPSPSAAKNSGRRSLWLGAGLGVFGLMAVLGLIAEMPGDDAETALPTQPTKAGVAPLQPVKDLFAQADEPPSQVAAARPTAVPEDRAAPSTAAAAAAAPPQPNVMDVQGLWRSNSGETYLFRQEGRELRLTAEIDGERVGRGRGEIDGAMLRLALSLQIQGAPFARLACDLQAAPDRRSFVGVCTGPNGQFPARIFR